MIGYAFHGRGGAYARDVTEEQWRLFDERIKDAYDIIISAERLSEACPGLYAAYLRLPHLPGFDEIAYEQIFESAISYEPAYYLYYFRKALHLLPWWYGEEGDWEHFAESISDRAGRQDGDALYARIIWFVDRWSPINVVDDNTDISWKRVRSGIRVLEKTDGY